jgi:hypothetical protein
MIIYSNLIKLFKHCGNYILFKLIMNIHEYSEYLDYFFDTLVSSRYSSIGGRPDVGGGITKLESSFGMKFSDTLC